MFGPSCRVLLLTTAAFPSVALHFEVGSSGRGLREEVLSRYLDFSAQHIAEVGWMFWDVIVTESEDSIFTKVVIGLSCVAVLLRVRNDSTRYGGKQWKRLGGSGDAYVALFFLTLNRCRVLKEG
jgi:hypothetical protein